MKKIATGLFCFAAVFAAHQHPASAPAEKPVALYPGLGSWRHPIATREPEAQKFFDQGLVLIYGFNRYEALRSFRKVAELDPHTGMAYWGMAMALGPYINMDIDPDVHMKLAMPQARDFLCKASAKPNGPGSTLPERDVPISPTQQVTCEQCASSQGGTRMIPMRRRCMRKR
jgi:hypothetical protein